MRICLVRPNWTVRWMIVPPIGLGYLAAAAKKAGHEVQIIDAWLQDVTPSELACFVHCSRIDLIGVQVYYDTVEWVKEFIKKAHKYTIKTKIIVGGPQITAFPETAKLLGADEGIIGEGEYLWFGTQPFDVNILPMPDWDSINLPAYWKYLNPLTVPTRGKRIGHIHTTRGCPFHCTFCGGHIIHGHKVRYRDIDNIIGEIEYLKSRWDINELWFQDDNVIVNYDRGIELFKHLESLKLHIRLPMGIRIENVTERMAQAMKDAGVYYTGIGIESGNNRVLGRVKKHLNLDRARHAIDILSRHGIMTTGFFIFGLPTETREEIDETVHYAMSTKLHHAQFGIFIPYPGSEDYDKRSELPQGELVKIQRNATLKFYLRPRIIWNFIKHFRWSQLRALWIHPWIRAWRWK